MHITTTARREIAREAAQRLADFDAEVVDANNEITDSALTAHGLLAGEALRAVRLAAIRDVTRPLLSGQSVTLRLEVKRHGRRLELE